jgi:subtilisin family serine protease
MNRPAVRPRLHRSSVCRWRAVLIPVLAVALLGLVGTAAQAAVVGQPVYKALQKSPQVRVMVSYNPGVPFDFSTPAAKAIFDAAVNAIDNDILGRFLPGEFTLLRRFVSINALAGKVTMAGLVRLQNDPRILRIDLDQGGRAHLVEARALAKIDPVLSVGFTGKGVTVAILDSGLDSQHPDLANDVTAEQCFCSSGSGCCPNKQTSQSGPGSAMDDNGHGTNVAGIVTSDGTIAPRGAAPDAKIVAVKVLASDNSFCCSSDVVAGLDWILNNRPEVNLVNMSLGTSDLFSGTCDSSTSYTSSYANAVNALRQRGVLVFASAGNNQSKSAMAAPACVANVISVGAVYDSNLGAETFPGVCTDSTTKADQVTCFSNSDAKTDLFAPGAVTTSTGLGGGTSDYLGTSQASPLVAACAADILQAYPGTAPDRLEAALKQSPTWVTDPKSGLSFPRLDCQAALSAASPNLSYYTVTPCRIIDTRQANGPFGGPALNGTSRTFQIAGNCGVPSTAKAVLVNLAAIAAPISGEIVLYPGNLTGAPATKSISFNAGQILSNNAVVGLATDGSGTMTALARFPSSSQVNVAVDVYGYFDQ